MRTHTHNTYTPPQSCALMTNRDRVHELSTLSDGILDVFALLLRDAGVQCRGLVGDKQPEQVPKDPEAA